MAKENTVIMLGEITKKPLVKVDGEGNFVVARLNILTVRRSWANEELKLKGTPRTDVQIIISRNENIIKKRIAPLKMGDIVLIKGTLCTRQVTKSYVCKHCGTINEYDGSIMVYVDPIFIEKISEPIEDDKELAKYLLSKSEVSNYAFIFGTLCRDPELYRSENGKKIECDFQVATNRKRRIIEDGPDKTTDYPYVKTYGTKAVEYYDALHMGSEIFMTSAIQSREFKRMIVCGECDREFEINGATMEIVPYSIEYINDCNIPESTRSEEDESEETSNYDADAREDSDYDTENNDYTEEYQDEEEYSDDDYEYSEDNGETDDYNDEADNEAKSDFYYGYNPFDEV